ncbi:MAG: tRNA dihydrouridine synthase DusB, partial [Hyphococcus sp.]
GAVANALASGEALVEPSLALQRAAALTQYRETIDLYGAPLGVRMARKHLAAYVDAAGVDIDPAERRLFRAALCRIASPDRVADALAAFFEADLGAARRIAA